MQHTQQVGCITIVYKPLLVCDSVIAVYLEIHHSITVDTAILECNSFLWNGISYSTSGIYSSMFQTSTGCDSVVNLDLTFQQFDVIATQSTDICFGTSTGFIQIDSIQNISAFNWSNGDTTLSIANLSAGTYTLNLEGISGCDTTLSFTINEYDDLDVSILSTPTPCDTNTATAAALINPTSFYPPYSYFWNNGDTTQIISGLAGGVVTLQVQDGNNCQYYTSSFINELNSPVISLVSAQDVSCFGASDGYIDVDVSGGNNVYVEWLSGQTTEDVFNLDAGTYTVVAVDTNNCSSSMDITISEPSILSYDTLSVDIPTCGASDGSISVQASGGTSPYTYLWGVNTGSQTGPTAQNLAAGIYQLTILDDQNCNIVNPYLLNNMTPDIVIDSLIYPNCSGTSGSIYVSVQNYLGQLIMFGQ